MSTRHSHWPPQSRSSMYRQLPTSSSSPRALSDDHEKNESSDSLDPKPPPVWLSSRVCFLLCALCTIVNLGLSLVPSSSVQPVKRPLLRQDIARLRRPSQFIRFDEIERPSPPEPKQFNNYPILLAQIDSAEKNKIFPDDTRQYMAHVGTISPEDRRVLVTETISTIVQFRAIDWGMEICELRLSLPASFSLDSTSSGTRILPFQSFPLSLYRVNATLPLDISTLSYATRPSRIAKVGDVHFAPGTDNATLWHRKFACTEEEVLSFELACSNATVAAGEGKSCRMEWWQNKDRPDPAIYLTQYGTK